jgi:O-antigen/teichoic acid export membrane protein
LSRLNGDPPRQVQAFLRAMRLMMLVGTPLCVAQAALAEPMLRWLFKPEYHVALWPVRLLSLAMVFRLAGYCAVSLLQAQGRFRTHAVVMAIQVPLWLTAASIGAYFGGATGVAVAAVVVNAIIDPTLVLLGVYRLEPTVRVADDLFVRPLMLSVLVALPIFVMLGAWGLFRSYPWLQLLLGGAVGGAGYWTLLGRLMPARADELRQHVATVLNGVRARLMRQRGTDTAKVQASTP